MGDFAKTVAYRIGLLWALATAAGSFCSAVTFKARLDILVGDAPQFVTTADFNRDGILDLAVTRPGLASISVMLGNGDGSFGAPTNIPVGTMPMAIAVADFNSDGNLD